MSEGNIPEVNKTSDVEEAPKALNENVESPEVQEVAAEAVDAAAENPQAEVTEVAKEAASVEAPAEAEAESGVEVPAEAPTGTETGSEAPTEAESGVEAPAEAEVPADLGNLSLAELSDLFDKLSQADDRMKRYKEAEAIKSAFYKRLSKEKAEAGLGAKVDEPSSREDVVEEVAPVTQTLEVKDNPFEAMETAFKGVYANYKKERAEYNRQQDAQREDNFAKKQAVIEDLKNLVEKQEDVNSTFPAFRELQNRWREIGPVPATKFRDLNDTYQFYVEKFYDMVKINRDLRDLDFKKNLEAKEAFCQAAEKLSENENVVEAFRELQKLHEQWKEFGPVAKEFRDSIWDRFKAATAVINKKYQAYFEGQKEKQQENLAEKTKLCEQVEAIAGKEVKSSNEWNTLSTEIEEIQKTWRTIGFATRKENQKIYDRFRAACDEFFNERDKNAKPENDFYGNLKAKKALVEEINEYALSGDAAADREAARAFADRWQGIGFVPFKEKDAIQASYTEAMKAKFPDFSPRGPRQGGGNAGRGGGSRKPLSEKDRLVQQYNKLQQDIDTYENNIGFFSTSKNSAPLIQKMQERIDAAKQELKDLEAKIRKAEESEEEK